jgi:5-methylcytosine-specific restriction protein A
MYTFKTYCERKFPNNWEIVDKGNGLFHFRDNLVSRGNGFIVVVQEEINNYEVILIFENFAKDLSEYAAKKITEANNPLSKLFDSNSNLTAIVHKHYIETNLDPSTNKFENWNFKLIYRKERIFHDADKFSDILISFILYIFPYKLESEEEGAAKSVLLTKYERSHLNRSLCLAYYGYNCKACGVNLKDKYGDIAREFIHVHHLNPIAQNGIIKPDPIKDFVPLCPNCHAIAHLKNPPITVEEIQKILENNGNTNA